MPEGIADSIDGYVALAVRLAQQPAWRDELRAKVVRNRDKLYRDPTCIAALQDTIERMVRIPAPAAG